MLVNKTVKLNDGNLMPTIALGVFLSHEDTYDAVKWALEAGYRHIDTAAAYHNEEAVGQAIKDSGIPRENLFVTTKLWNEDVRQGRTREALMESLKRLQMDYVDLYLMHWPVEGRIEAYQVMEQLQKEGYVRSIGVSNFRVHHLEELMANTHVTPAVDQMELNPQFIDEELLDYAKEHEIVLEAWSPLGRGAYINDPVIVGIAERYNHTSVQVILRWLLQKGIVVLPKSVHKERIIANKNVYDFELSDDDMALMDGLNRHQRMGPDPDHFDF